MYGYLALAGVLLVIAATVWLTIRALGKAKEETGFSKAQRETLEEMARREAEAAKKMAGPISTAHADHARRLRDIQKRRSRS